MIGLRVVAMQCYVAVEFVIGSIRNGDGYDKPRIRLIERAKIIVLLDARHAFWFNFFLTWSAKRRRESFKFEVLPTTRARAAGNLLFSAFIRKPFVPITEARHFVNFVQRVHNKKITNAKTYRKVIY